MAFYRYNKNILRNEKTKGGNKMKRKGVKTLALTMTSAMVVAMTAGCGNSGGGDTKSDSTDTGTEDTADDADTGSAETETGTEATAADIGEPNG